MRSRTTYDVAILGWGTHGRHQLTLESLWALEQARDIVVSPGATEDLFEFLKTFKAPIHDLNPLYGETKNRNLIYREIVDSVLSLGRRRGSTAYIQYGHPLIYSKPTRLILREGRKNDLRVLVFAGISSIDEIYCLLKLDIRDRDMQIYHAQHFYEKNKLINPYADLLLMQVGVLGETHVCRDAGKRSAGVKTRLFEKLQRQLEKFYPPDHRFLAICLRNSDRDSHQVLTGKIRQLTRLAPFLHYGHTLYIKAKSAT